MFFVFFFFFKQKTAYEMRISDWSSDVCSSDLISSQGVSGPSPDHAFGQAVRKSCCYSSLEQIGRGGRRSIVQQDCDRPVWVESGRLPALQARFPVGSQLQPICFDRGAIATGGFADGRDGKEGVRRWREWGGKYHYNKKTI